MTTTAPRRTGNTGRPDHIGRPGPVAIAAGVCVVAALLAAGLTGATATPVLGDPGVFVRWGLPVARVVVDLAAMITIGGLFLLSCVLVPAAPGYEPARRITVFGSAAWAVGASIVLVLGGADVAGLPPTDPAFGTALAEYATSVQTGRLALLATGAAALTATAVAAARGPVGAAWSGVIAVLALLPSALAGHASGKGHEVVSSGWWLHVMGVCGWTGALIVLALVADRLRGGGLLTATHRFSAFALWCYLLVSFSGVASAIPRLRGPADLLTTGYGLVVSGKFLLLVALGFAGWWHRRRTMTAMQDGDRGPFRRLLAGEVTLIAVAVGLAAALSRTPPPIPTTLAVNPTPAEIVTGAPLPPPLTAARLFTQVTPDVLWIAVAVALAAGYLALVWRLHSRGDRWPLGRTITWLVGCLALLYVTCGGVAVYGRVLFSVHMVAHMSLSMVVPPLLVFGAPVTLLLRGLPARHDGSRGPREWLLAVMESRYVTVITHPVFAAAMFSLSLIAFYYTSLFGLALRTHVGHELMMVHFLLAGYLFCFSVIGVDPAPVRLSFPFRLLLLFVTMAFHAFFAVSLMSRSTLLEATYFSSLGWGIDALADQRDGGAIAWAVGDGPTLLLAIVLAVQWSLSDDRKARQHDRAADRNGDADLLAYNAMLADLRERDGRVGRPPAR